MMKKKMKLINQIPIAIDIIFVHFIQWKIIF